MVLSVQYEVQGARTINILMTNELCLLLQPLYTYHSA